MDRDNPFRNSYIREGAMRVQKPRLSFRQSGTDLSSSRQHQQEQQQRHRPQLHLKLRRRSSNGSDISVASNEPAIGEDDVESAQESATNGDHASLLSSHSSNLPTGVRRRSTGAFMGSGATAGGAHRRSVIVRPADHTRPTVHFVSNRPPEILITAPPSIPRPFSSSTGQISTASSSNRTDRPNRNSAIPVPWTDQAISSQRALPLPPPAPPIRSIMGGHGLSSHPSYNTTGYGSAGGSASTNSRKKTVTFCDSSETEDASSCLSISTQATTVEGTDDGNSDTSLQSPKKQARSIIVPSQPPRPFRRRSRSFSEVDRHLLLDDGRDEEEEEEDAMGFIHISSRRITKAYTNQRADRGVRVRFREDENTQKQLEEDKAKLAERQTALELKQSKLTDDLKDAVTKLLALQSEKENLDQERTLYLQTVGKLEQQNSQLREELAETSIAKDGLEQALKRKADEAGQLQIGVDMAMQNLAGTSQSLAETSQHLDEANEMLAAANMALAELKESLAAEKEKVDVFRETKEALEVRCTDLEEQVVAARDANKELHTLMASQIDDLEKTRDALQTRLDVLEEDLVGKRLEADRLVAARDQLQSEKETADQAVAALAKEKTALEENIQELKESLNSAQTDNADLKDNVVAALQTEKDALAEKVASLEAQSSESSIKAAALQATSDDLKAKIDTLESDKMGRQEEADVLAKTLAILQDENAALKEEVESHSAELRKARQDAEEAASTQFKSKMSKLEEDNATLKVENEQLKTGSSTEAEISQEKYATLEKDCAALNDKIETLQADHTTLKAEHTTLHANHEALKESSTSIEEATATAIAAKALVAELEQTVADLMPLREQHAMLSGELGLANSRVEELTTACTAADAEVMTLQDQLAKLRARLAVSAPSSTRSTSSKRGKKTKDELVIVRNPADRGRFQVMKKSEFYSSRSPSRSSHKTDDDSG